MNSRSAVLIALGASALSGALAAAVITWAVCARAAHAGAILSGRRRHSFPGPQDPAALRATDAPLWPSCAERKTLRPISFAARGGAFASFGRALRRPFGLPPFINRHLFTSGCVSIYRSRMSHLTVPHPSVLLGWGRIWVLLIDLSNPRGNQDRRTAHGRCRTESKRAKRRY